MAQYVLALQARSAVSIPWAATAGDEEAPQDPREGRLQPAPAVLPVPWFAWAKPQVRFSRQPMPSCAKSPQHSCLGAPQGCALGARQMIMVA